MFQILKRKYTLIIYRQESLFGEGKQLRFLPILVVGLSARLAHRLLQLSLGGLFLLNRGIEELFGVVAAHLVLILLVRIRILVFILIFIILILVLIVLVLIVFVLIFILVLIVLVLVFIVLVLVLILVILVLVVLILRVVLEQFLAGCISAPSCSIRWPVRTRGGSASPLPCYDSSWSGGRGCSPTARHCQTAPSPASLSAAS